MEGGITELPASDRFDGSLSNALGAEQSHSNLIGQFQQRLAVLVRDADVGPARRRCPA
jgi:hypothetical protein